MKTNIVSITATKKNFDAAIAAQLKHKDLTSTCLLAQAIKQAYPKKRVDVSSDYATIGTKHFHLSAKAQKLIERFDRLYARGESKAEKNRIKKFRAGLPVTIKMTEEVAEKAVAALYAAVAATA